MFMKILPFTVEDEEAFSCYVEFEEDGSDDDKSDEELILACEYKVDFLYRQAEVSYVRANVFEVRFYYEEE